MNTQITPFRHYILNTSFHGLRFLAERERHWTERVFWLICCILGWIAAILLILSAWSDFQNNSISFVVDSNYLQWNTPFPSISICETDNQPHIAQLTDLTFGDPHDYNLDEVVKELVFFRGLSFYTLQICGPEAQFPSEDCFKKNFSSYSSQIRSSCSQIFKTCKWNDENFDCCHFFGKLNTEMGICYALNSMQVANVEKFPMVSNKTTGPGSLYLELKGFNNVYILGEQEVPSFTTLTTDVLQVTPNIHYKRLFAIKEIENEFGVSAVDIHQRKCRFPDEIGDLDVYSYYSYSSCSVQCRKKAQLKICDCAHHLMPNTEPERFCNISGLFCMNKNYNQLSVLKPYWANRTGLVCDCLPSCTEMELSIIMDEKNGISEDFAIVELTLQRLPTERFKRNVVRGKLDLVVSMGGSTALFLGASILSFVELLYYFTVRPISNYDKSNNVHTTSRLYID